MAQFKLDTVGLTEDKAKKTVIPMMEYLADKLSDEQLKEFAQKFAIKSSGNTGTGKPREATKLYDKDGNLLGGKCSATGKWFSIENYNHHHGLAKEAQNVKSRLNTEAKKIEAEAEEIRLKAKEADKPADKLALFEKYDAELEKASKIRNKAITVADFAKQVPNFNTVEDLARSLQVEVITTKPKVETSEESEEA